MKQISSILVLFIALVFISCEKDPVSSPQSNTPKITQLPEVYSTNDLKVSLAYSVEPPVYTGHIIEWHYSDSSKIERSAVPVGTQTHFYPYDGTFYYYALLRDTIKHTVIDSVFGSVIINSGLASAKIFSFSPKDTTLNAGNTILFRVNVDTTNQRRNILLWDFGGGVIDTTSVLVMTNEHMYSQYIDYTARVILRDTLSKQSLDSSFSNIHWAVQTLNVSELLNTRYLSVTYYVQLYNCSDSISSLGTSPYIVRLNNNKLPITWLGDSLSCSVSDSWSINYSDPNRPNDWYSSYGSYNSSVNAKMTSNKQTVQSFSFGSYYSDDYTAQHKMSREFYGRGISVRSITYAGTVADSIYYYLPLYLTKDRLLGASHRDYYWETPYPQGSGANGCGVSWEGNPQAYIRLKFYK